MLILTCCCCRGCCCTGLQLELTHFSEKKSFLVLYSSSFLLVIHNMETHWVNFPTMKCILFASCVLSQHVLLWFHFLYGFSLLYSRTMLYNSIRIRWTIVMLVRCFCCMSILSQSGHIHTMIISWELGCFYCFIWLFSHNCCFCACSVLFFIKQHWHHILGEKERTHKTWKIWEH